MVDVVDRQKNTLHYYICNIKLKKINLIYDVTDFIIEYNFS